MTITLSPETEAKLRQKAERDGENVDTIADMLIAAALEWEVWDREDTIAGVNRGLADSEAGRVKPASEVFEKLRSLSASH